MEAGAIRQRDLPLIEPDQFGNTELRAVLRDTFATRTTADWLAFGLPCVGGSTSLRLLFIRWGEFRERRESHS